MYRYLWFSPKCCTLLKQLSHHLNIHAHAVIKEIPQAPCSHFSRLPLERCRWSMAVGYTGPCGTFSEGNRYSVWESSDRPQISLIHLRWLCDSGAEMLLIRGQRATRRRYTLSNPLWYLAVIHIAGSNLLCWCSDLAQDGEGEHGRWFIGTKPMWNEGKMVQPETDRTNVQPLVGEEKLRTPLTRTATRFNFRSQLSYNLSQSC